ncbi:Inositol monophosphatase family protein [Paenibacillus konkukensis]|uniref:Inositol monophosphatase family protein n=1 Tax=Paenibacillus konkukensis TaxID=2020716 RepID=A0ABY4RN54_9BACL|nr:Inositol monophosphatase family protein [Paenibacillus konkukensis]
MDHFKAVYESAKEWALEAGRNLRDSLGQQLHVDYKTSEADLVTEKDREIEQFFIRNIKETYPHHRIIGEEGMLAESPYHPADEIV